VSFWLHGIVIVAKKNETACPQEFSSEFTKPWLENPIFTPFHGLLKHALTVDRLRNSTLLLHRADGVHVASNCHEMSLFPSADVDPKL
jgi:hypothetical protein